MRFPVSVSSKLTDNNELQLKKDNIFLKTRNDLLETEIENVRRLEIVNFNEFSIHRCQSTSPQEESHKSIANQDLCKELSWAVHPVSETQPELKTADPVSETQPELKTADPVSETQLELTTAAGVSNSASMNCVKLMTDFSKFIFKYHFLLLIVALVLGLLTGIFLKEE
jgi:hypothetical protein